MVHVFCCNKPITTCVCHPLQCSILCLDRRSAPTGHLEFGKLILVQARPRDGAHRLGSLNQDPQCNCSAYCHNAQPLPYTLISLEHVLSASQPLLLSCTLVQGVTEPEGQQLTPPPPCRIWTGSKAKASALTSPSLHRCAASTAPVRNTSSFLPASTVRLSPFPRPPLVQGKVLEVRPAISSRTPQFLPTTFLSLLRPTARAFSFVLECSPNSALQLRQLLLGRLGTVRVGYALHQLL